MEKKESAGKDRRRNFYIKKEFQRNFILKFCGLVLTGSILSGAIIYFMSTATITTSFDNIRLVIKSTADYILPSVLLSGLIVVLITVAATFFITLFTSHKIAGPLFRIEKDINEITNGNLQIEFNLREGDEIKPIAVALNSMVASLKAHVNLLKAEVAELEKAAASNPQIKDKTIRLKSELDKYNS